MTARLSSRSVLKDTLVISLITLIIFILIDLFAGNVLLAFARKEGKKDAFRIPHARYHHALQASYEGPAYWGPFEYWLCTNASGMKSACRDKNSDEKHFDIAFIGDSFTEGVGVTYEDSFVGMVAKAHPELKIANLGVVSYTPTIYLKKLEDFLNRGYTFKKVIVFVDIGDIMDEALYFEDAEGNAKMTAEIIHPGAVAFLKRNFKKYLPLTYEGLYYTKLGITYLSQWLRPGRNTPIAAAPEPLPAATSFSYPTPKPNSISPAPQESVATDAPKPEVAANHPAGTSALATETKNKTKEPWIYEREFARSAWTYNFDAPGYGDLGVRRSMDKALKQMERVATLLESRGIKLSVGVYPWPAQLLFDREDSLQVEMWKKFCEQRCENFYNAFPSFFSAVRTTGVHSTIVKYYFPGDMHFGKEGNALVAETILRSPLNIPNR
jgi:hypothetical protein